MPALPRNGRFPRLFTTFRTNTPQGEIECRHFKPAGQRHIAKAGVGRQIDIRNFTTLIAEKVAMLPHVRAEPGRAPIERYLPHQAARHQHTQAIVNSSEGNLRHPLLRPVENFVCGRVIMAVRHHFKNFLALPRGTEAPSLERLLEILVQ